MGQANRQANTDFGFELGLGRAPCARRHLVRRRRAQRLGRDFAAQLGRLETLQRTAEVPDRRAHDV